jgi:hypothetical protein
MKITQNQNLWYIHDTTVAKKLFEMFQSLDIQENTKCQFSWKQFDQFFIKSQSSLEALDSNNKTVIH